VLGVMALPRRFPDMVHPQRTLLLPGTARLRPSKARRGYPLRRWPSWLRSQRISGCVARFGLVAYSRPTQLSPAFVPPPLPVQDSSLDTVDHPRLVARHSRIEAHRS
jgi:hypothetical protein